MYIYFYVSFFAPGMGIMATVVRQMPTDQGLNIANTTKYVSNLVSQSCVLVAWNVITEARYNEFNVFMEKSAVDHGQEAVKAFGKSALGLLKGEGAASESQARVSPLLRAVAPDPQSAPGTESPDNATAFRQSDPGAGEAGIPSPST